MQPRMRDAVISFLSRQWQDAIAACRVLGEATLLWPAAAEMTGQARRPTTREQRRAKVAERQTRRQKILEHRQARRRHVADTHAWTWVGRSRRCTSCLAWYGRDVTECQGVPPAWTGWINHTKANGHRLRHAILHDAGERNVMPMTICMACGSWSSTAGQSVHCKLATHCQEKLTKVGANAIDRVMRGFHPKSGRHPALCTVYR